MTRRRPGMSLTEVLVALFIMALGTIAILTMFPLGMMQMGQALKDDRTSQAASAADAYLRWYWKTQVTQPSPPNYLSNSNEPFVRAMYNPSDTYGAPPGGANPFPQVVAGSGAVGAVPSYPVVVDPFGWLAPWSSQNSATQQMWFGNFATPRRTLNLITAQSAPQYAQRVCSLMDGLGYNTDGTGTPALTASGTTIERELRYNWLWVVQVPDIGAPKTANLTVVVFDKRAFQYAPAGAEAVFIPVANPSNPVAGRPGSTTVSFVTGTNLGVQKGGWIVDVSTTVIDPSSKAAFVPPAIPPSSATPTPGVRNANFYRVISVTDNGTTVDVELQVPLKDDTGDTTGFDPLNHRRFVVPLGVSEVFERPSLTAEDF